MFINVFKKNQEFQADCVYKLGVYKKKCVVIIGTSGSGPFNAGVGTSNPVSGGHFWPPEQNRKWPEVGNRNLTHYFT